MSFYIIIDSRGAEHRVGCHKHMSNKREWNKLLLYEIPNTGQKYLKLYFLPA